MSILKTVLKGIAMGAADVVPGVSGGTIAFITGIYDKLLESIRRINPSLWRLYRQQGFSALWQNINGTFLVALFSGILFSIATLAKGISWLLSHHPIPTWSFFFGLILVSVYHMLTQVDKKRFHHFVLLSVAVAFAYFITVQNPIDLSFNLMTVFFAGMIAICAMILPGISGSFILLLIGMYTPILSAIKSAQFEVIGIFILGCITGLLCFSHLLSWLLRQYRHATMMTLTGLMIGTLPKIWPWKETLTWRINSHGEKVPNQEHNLSPWQFEQTLHQDPQVLMAVVMAALAIALVLVLERKTRA
ncbi:MULTISPECIES: DUF368 domain-containing protein [unclassified Vibrio]|uniref:DUF368 domain-containing protein n=1 Tax=Vibrio sp. HB236076 TaxID=3232307 RepID=A0AB39HFQ7_9VIBR|nr:DUF368 domain-containing protein [Vibrio sp. HB161653]MDP5252602.1 DUF368 domain-containing protein [Vibrio sp. HB161653]